MRSHPLSALVCLALAGTCAGLPAQDAIPAAAPTSATPFGRVHLDRPRDDVPTVWVRGDRYKASIDADGCTFVPFLGADAPRSYPVRLALRSVRVGATALDLAPRGVVHGSDRITIDRADLVEFYEASVDHLEQSFRFDRLPAGGGDLVIELAVATDLAIVVDGDDLSFRGPCGDVFYRGLVAIDAAGERIGLPIRCEDGAIRLTVPGDFVARAQLPLVVDPLFGTRIIATVPDQRMAPDVAYNPGVDEYLVTWNVPFNATDMDVAAVRTDSSFNPIGSSFWIDFTTASWLGPRVACKQREGMFLVVAQVNNGGTAPYWISGRRYEAVGTYRFLHTQQDIEKQTMPLGLPGNSFHPDVGADPYTGIGPAYFTVVYEYRPIGGNGDILLRHLQADGTAVFGSVSAINVGPYDDRWPSVSKSAANGGFGLVWEQVGAGGGANIVAAVIDVNGLQRVAPYFLDSSANEDTRPRISTAARIPGTSHATFLVAWQRNFDPFANVGRLHCAAVTDNPAAPLVNRWDLSNLLAVPAGRMAYEPVVESDGLRFAVAHTEVANALPGQGRNDLFVSTVALDGVQLLAHESRLPLWNSGPSAFSPAIVGQFGASLQNSRVYGVVSGTSAISVVGYVYVGTQSGTAWNVRTGGCGGLPINYSGRPDFGDTVRLSVGGNDPFRVILLGFPTPMVTLGSCTTCLIGVAHSVTVSSPYTWPVPYFPSFVGTRLTAQGYSVGVGPCLGAIRLTDAVDFTLR